ncbi:hypothetical protein HPB48_001651 [Haemaphysalis longicornis]|uniref:Uncharacterized protein n=1 Tax=Haemaphysalis longicornis TaxID=44386 RepID=A0A9J6GU57_HAELO|nr:hypothetical protein HPB48_001651 [Haemaphysalis longicornis]
MLPLAQAGASPAVAASKTIKGYYPVSMQVICMDTAQHEDCPPSEEEYLEDMIRIWWRKHSSKAPKGNDAPGQQQTAARSGHAPQGGVASKSSTHRSSKPQWRPKHTPHIGRDELIVVLKPSTTLDLKAPFAPGQVGSAVRNLLRECGNVELSVWPVWEQNVIVCGLNSEPAARRLLGDVTLTINGRQLPFRGYAKATGDVCKGVITIDPNDTSASLKPKLRWKKGEILSVRRLGSSNVAVVIFEGKFVPRQIYYNDQGIPGLVEHKCTPRCLICGGEHLTGTSGCNGKYRKPIKPGTSPTTDKRKDDFKKIQASKGSHKTSTLVSGRPAPVKNNTRSETVARTQIFSAEDFPTLPNAPNEVSDWVRAASRPRCPPSLLTTPTEVALQRQNAELRRQSEILANKIQELETRLAGLTESQTTAGTSEPMQQSEPSERDESASVASGVSSASRCSDCTFVQRVPHAEQRLTKLERTIEELPKKILEGVKASFAELWQQELSQIIVAVTDSVMDTVQDWVSTQLRDNRSRSRSPRSDSHRRAVAMTTNLAMQSSGASVPPVLQTHTISQGTIMQCPGPHSLQFRTVGSASASTHEQDSPVEPDDQEEDWITSGKPRKPRLTARRSFDLHAIGLHLPPIQSGAAAERLGILPAIILAAKLPAHTCADISLHLRHRDRLAVVKTHHVEVVNRLLRVQSITLAGRTYEVARYLMAPTNSCLGVIDGIAPDATPDGLLRDLDCYQSDVLSARRMGSTNSAILTFSGTQVPFYVYYQRIEFRCRPHKPRAHHCTICQQYRHHTLACPGNQQR